MSPLKEMYAAQDEVSDYAVAHQQARFQPIGSAIPDPRPAPRFVPRHILGYSFSHGRAFNDLDVSVAVARLQDSGELSEEIAERIDAESIKACRARLGEESHG